MLPLVFSCGSSPSENQTIENGSWSGMAADSIPITFQVNGSSIENAVITVNFDLDTHPDSTMVWSFGTEIADNEFSHTESSGATPWEFGLDIQGTFSPPDQVQGSLTTWCVHSQGGSTEADTLETSWTAQPD